MAVEVKRKQNESVESLLRRFSKRVMQSRVVFNAKAHRFFNKKKTKRQVKDAALRRQFIKNKKEYLQKTGQFPANDELLGLPPAYKKTLMQKLKLKK